MKELVTLHAKQAELSTLLVQQQRASQLPAKEPPVFTGDAFDYPAFTSAFDSIISSNVQSNRDRLYFLEKYTRGKANEVVKGFLAVNSENAYNEARKILDQRFGNPVYVAEAYKTRIRKWPQIQDGDSAGLQDFSDFLVRCQEAVKTVGSLAELDSTQTLTELSAKLPSYSGVKWCRHAYEAQMKSSLRVSFSEFVKFVKAESDLANDPIFSPDALKREKRKQPERNPKTRFRRSVTPTADSFAINTKQGPVPTFSRRLTVQCVLCEKNHSLEKCSTFKGKSLDERRNFIISKGLCFGCLKSGHLSVSCQSRLTCEECGKLHPTPMHMDKPKRSPVESSQRESELNRTRVAGRNSGNLETSSSAKINAIESADDNASVCGSAVRSDGVTTSMIVPVILHHKDNSEVKVKTYALLDDGSDSTFVKNSTLKALGVEGPEISLRLNTMHGRAEIPAKRIEGLVVQRFDEGTTVVLPRAYSRDSIPSRKDQIPTSETAKKWPHLKGIEDKIPPLQNNVDVGILIGCNCPRALKPQEVILGEDDDPYAVRTILGWGIIGPSSPQKDTSDVDGEDVSCHRLVTSEVGSTSLKQKFVVDAQTKEVINPVEVRKMFEVDFSERDLEERALSLEDRKFLEIVQQGIRHREDGHYEMPLPIRDKTLALPNNRTLAKNRLKPLRRRFQTDRSYHRHYVEFMNKIIQNGYAERVSEDKVTNQSSKSVWYIPHHGVYHPKKPNKIRVVFDCSAQFEGESLNKHLLQGPDLTNNLTGVLCRFRREPVAFMCDIESMFFQVKVPEDHRDLLRFLWWDDGDISREPQEYRMTVHLFGAASSPACANFALKASADNNEERLGSAPAEFLRRDFYVDDGLKSVSTVEEAIDLVKSIKEMCQRGGFNLHKFTSNSKEVIQQIPVKDRAEEIKSIGFERDTLPTERALGVQWCIESDSFKFTISLKDRPCSRRGILSTVSSIFDPLGFVAPVLLEGKSILQELCRCNVGWDDPVPEGIQARWQKWKSELHELQNLSIPRCYKPADFGPVVKAELHHFSDASFKGYSQCSYLRMTDTAGKIHCSFITGKARVTPLKKITVPRLELTAAVVSVRVSEQLRRELEVEVVKEVFWTDSKVVLGYIANEVRRFHVFVANRVQEIQERSSVEQWRYIDTKRNPADDGSRGLHASQISGSKWITAPDFLWKPEDEWEVSSKDIRDLESDDPEVKKIVCMASEVTPVWPSLVERLSYFSDWLHANKAVALCRRYVRILRSKISKKFQLRPLNAKGGQSGVTPIRVQELKNAEIVILTAVQKERSFDVSHSGPLRKLNPMISSDGVIRVGGRLSLSTLPDSTRYPAILPRYGHITDLVINYYHTTMQHQGRGITMNELRARGYWIVGASAAVSRAISKCVTCRKLRGVVQEQRMAELPEDRIDPAPPFTNCAVDFFGPFIIKQGRKELKRYGALFTCMASRAVHIEVAQTLETDSFISALRRFICRRGPIRQLRSDQGTNFVGAQRELKIALEEMDNERIGRELQRHDCDWFHFKMNVPSASHMGGTWERQIRTVRNVLATLLHKNGLQLDDESLHTLLCEAEAIVNSRPLTIDSLSDPQSLTPLTPNHLLTMKTKVVLPPPGAFQSADKYCRKRWKRVQHLANQFWVRWKKEYLLNLQQRQKWLKPRRNLCVGDIVLIKGDEGLPRNRWQLARVVTAYKGADGYVRTTKVAVADSHLDDKGRRIRPARFLERPVHKLVLLQESET